MELNQNRRKTKIKNKYVSANNTKGITLIALVITIIVLLILAAVSIAILTGENGILKKVSTAKEKSNKEIATEIIKLKITNLQMKLYDKEQRMPTLQELADDFCEDNEIEYVNIEKKETAKINDKIEIGENTKIYTKLEAYPYEFEIDSDLQIARVDGEEMNETDLEDKAPEDYIKPSGTKEITKNGKYNVSKYEEVDVNVETDTKYTEEEYQEYGTTKYNEGMSANANAVGYKSGILTPDSTGKNYIECGFKPKVILVGGGNTDGTVNKMIYMYKEEWSVTNSFGMFYDSSRPEPDSFSTYPMEGDGNIETSSGLHIYKVDNTGFGFYFPKTDKKIYWTAFK